MSHENRIYVIGAGFAGREIAREIHTKGVLGRVVAFLDDDPAKIGRRLDNIPVLGPIDDVVRLVDKTPADEALIAIPSASRELLRRLHSTLRKAHFSRIRILPTLSQIIDDQAHFIQTREIDPQDLLGRTPVNINLKQSLEYLRGKRVLITGAGGSIGSELARQLLAGGAERLYILGHGENSIYEIDSELRLLQEEGVGDAAYIVPIIGELTDTKYIRFLLGRLKADVVFHAAAYKHVPMMEANPVAAVQNNVFGTRTLLRAAVEHGASRFVLVSTDKAVEPVSMYGASKRLAEEITLSGSGNNTAAMVVRFGNVLGSRGSILPLFQRQIAKGGPVTVTDRRASRFFMTIPEAVSLTLKAGGVGEANQLYVLDMGDPVNIYDLAQQMLRFYGFEPGVDIPIREIGLRPGEKLDETLFGPNESPTDSGYERILRVRRPPVDRDTLEATLQRLEPVCFSGLDLASVDQENHQADTADGTFYRNRRILRTLLRQVIPTVRDMPHEPEY